MLEQFQISADWRFPSRWKIFRFYLQHIQISHISFDLHAIQNEANYMKHGFSVVSQLLLIYTYLKKSYLKKMFYTKFVGKSIGNDQFLNRFNDSQRIFQFSPKKLSGGVMLVKLNLETLKICYSHDLEHLPNDFLGSSQFSIWAQKFCYTQMLP